MTKQHTPTEPKIGDAIKGSWRDEATGKTYYGEGIVRQFPAGLFVESKSGITPLDCFFHFSEILPEDCQSKEDGICQLSVDSCKQCEVTELSNEEIDSLWESASGSTLREKWRNLARSIEKLLNN